MQTNPNQYYQFNQAQPQYNVTGVVSIQNPNMVSSYPVGPNQCIALVDQAANVIYLKATDPMGMPLQLRTFDYKERKQASFNSGDYVTKEEFTNFQETITQTILPFIYNNLYFGGPNYGNTYRCFEKAFCKIWWK